MQKEITGWNDIVHFKKEEFDCHGDSRANYMNLKFVHLLDMIRDEYGKKMIVNSGYRTMAWNLKIGGVPDSAHVKGLAADILCKSSIDRFRLITIALKYIDRIGIGKDFVHMDASKTLPHPRIWTYY